ncbi:MAG: hypothetical protein E5W34_03515, partial [Mesorhizobium sp.]
MSGQNERSWFADRPNGERTVLCSDRHRVPRRSPFEICIELGRDGSNEGATFSPYEETVTIEFKRSGRIVECDGPRAMKELLAGFAEPLHQIDC